MLRECSILAVVLGVINMNKARFGPLCQILHEKYSDRGTDQSVWVQGQTQWVSVYHDDRQPTRAAATLLYTSLRHGLRYKHVRVRSGPKQLCQLERHLSQMYEENAEDELVLAPAISWNEPVVTSCRKETNDCGSSTSKANLKGPGSRLQMNGNGAVPTTTAIFVHLTKRVHMIPDCKHAVKWSFYNNFTALKTCGFTLKQQPTPLVTLYIPPDLLHLGQKLLTNNTDVHYQLNIIMMVKNNIKDLIRLLHEDEASFLVLDYEIWNNYSGLLKMEPLPDKNCVLSDDQHFTIRIADSNLRKYALPILEVSGRFNTSVEDIQEILVNSTNVKEAACAWALNRTDKFEKWLQLKWHQPYEVVVFLCANDPDRDKYVDVLQTVRKIYYQKQIFNNEFDVSLRLLNINCNDEYALMKLFVERTQSVYWPRLIGALAAGAGAKAAASVAVAMNTILVFYDIPSSDLSFYRGTRSSTGQASHLVAGIQYLLSESHARRLAVISENTKLANLFVSSFREAKYFMLKELSLVPSIDTALKVLMEVNARYVFINASPDIAKSILCEANKLGITIYNQFVWIFREWRGEHVKCDNNSIISENSMMYSVSFSWMGGNSAQLNLSSESQLILDSLEYLWKGQPWPFRAAPLADGLILLIAGFHKFIMNLPELKNDIHTGNNSWQFWEFNSNPPHGVTQVLSINNQSLNSPLIFITKWQEKGQQLKSILKITDNNTKVIYEPLIISKKEAILDGALSCYTTRSGDEFWPSCHDTIWLTGVIIILQAIPLAYLARRTRKKRIERRKRLLTARLLARGKRAQAALAAHLVDRSAIKIHRELGSGRFGRVHLALLQLPYNQTKVVAAKTLRVEATPAEEREILNEAVILASLHHKNIIKLEGICATGGSPLVLMEHAFFGDLLMYLQERRHLVRNGDDTEQVSSKELTRFGCQVAAALDYLRHQRLVHRDVRAANCLVDDRRCLKLGDFGLARRLETENGKDIDEYRSQGKGPLPVLWMAPESLKHGVFSTATDAWSLGVFLLELVTLGARPYSEWSPPRIIRYVCDGGYPPLPSVITLSTQNLLLGCWQYDPNDRLTAADVLDQLARNEEAITPAFFCYNC